MSLTLLRLCYQGVGQEAGMTIVRSGLLYRRIRGTFQRYRYAAGKERPGAVDDIYDTEGFPCPAVLVDASNIHPRHCGMETLQAPGNSNQRK